jgi:hypothetical protein
MSSNQSKEIKQNTPKKHIFIKIYEFDDIFYYIQQFLSFEDKLKYGFIIGDPPRLIKNKYILSKKYEKKKLSEIFNICNYCYCELASDQQMMLSDKYKNFLYYHEDSESNSSESSNSDDDQDNTKIDFIDFYSDYNNNSFQTTMIKAHYLQEENEFVCSTFFDISSRAFWETLENKNILFKEEHLKKCMFCLDAHDGELEISKSYKKKLEKNKQEYELLKLDGLTSKFYDEFYNKINEIYVDGILKDNLKMHCKRCGTFGHCSTSKSCIFYTKIYENYKIEKDIFSLVNDLTNNVIDKIEKEKKEDERRKKLCTKCNIYFFAKKCKNKMCKKCCDCNHHKKNLKIEIKKLKNKIYSNF